MNESISTLKDKVHLTQKHMIIISVVVLISYAILVLIISYLYSLDNSYVDISTLKAFVERVDEKCYDDSGEIYPAVSNCYSVSTLMATYNSAFADRQIYYSYDATIDSVEEACDVYESFLPTLLKECNPYVRSWVYCNAIYSTMSLLDEDSPSYYEAKCTMLEELRLHEVYLTKYWQYKLLYRYCTDISYACMLILMVLSSVSMVYLWWYYYNYFRVVSGRE